jgi:hypothetical protein
VHDRVLMQTGHPPAEPVGHRGRQLDVARGGEHEQPGQPEPVEFVGQPGQPARPEHHPHRQRFADESLPGAHNAGCGTMSKHAAR